MTLKEAKTICAGLEETVDTCSEEDFFLYTEAMGVVIEKTKSPR